MNPRIALAVVLLVMVAFLGVGIWYSAKWAAWNKPWGQPGQDVLIQIEPGWSANQIGNLLQEKGIIQDTFFYYIMADFNGFNSKLKAGEYMCLGTMSPKEILENIALGRAYQWKITFPEGLTLKQIAQKYGEYGICDPQEFINLASQGHMLQDAQLKDGGSVTATGAEGILFPDTYSLEKNTPVEKLIGYMVNRFNSVFTELSRDIPLEEQWWASQESGGIHALVTLASIVEKEAKRPEDRAQVATVFLNRIKNGMTLGSDATLHYILDAWDRPLTKSDLEFDSPYNTHKYKGWPPGPICNPGRAALEAAMRPAKTDDLYFLSTGDGVTEFFKTYQEHQARLREVRANGES